MAFEVYDNVAFFWFLLSILGVILVPFTYHMFYFFRVSDELSQGEELLTSLGKKKREYLREQERKEKRAKIFSLKTLAFAVLWLIFLLSLTQISHYQQEHMTTFDPYEMLGLQAGATEAEIKKAYRKMSLKYHPDKNPGDEAAAQKFHLLTKAHTILTDETARENFEKYGNPDGYQGASGSIGLPEFLKNPSYKILILFFYFCLIVFLPPLVVYFWWRKNSGIHESGVHVKTLQWLNYRAKDSTETSYLLETLCSCQEYIPNTKWQTKEVVQTLEKIHSEFKNDLPQKIEVFTQGTIPTLLLFTAHLYRVNIACQLAREYQIHVLKTVHKILAVMLQIWLYRFQRVLPLQQIMTLSQHLVQAVHFGESQLYQIPLDSDQIAELKQAKKGRKSVTRIEQLKKLSKEERRELLKDVSLEKWDDINNVLDLIPDPHIEIDYEVEGAKGVHEGDLVKVWVNISRQQPSPEHSSSQKRPHHHDDSDNDEKNSKNNNSDGKNKNGDNNNAEESGDDEEMFRKQRELREKSRKKKNLPPVHVHAPYFPDAKFEKWIVLLEDDQRKVVDIRRVNSLAQPIDLEFYVLATTTKSYTVYALCDSYFGCDTQETFKVVVEKTEIAKSDKNEQAKGKVELSDDASPTVLGETNEEDEMSFWANVADKVATVILLAIIIFGLYTYASQKPWFQNSVQPRIDAFLVFAQPVTSRLSVIFAPVFSFWEKHVAPLLHVEAPPPAKLDPSRIRRPTFPGAF